MLERRTIFKVLLGSEHVKYVKYNRMSYPSYQTSMKYGLKGLKKDKQKTNNAGIPEHHFESE